MTPARARLIGPLAGALFVVLSVVSALLIFSDSPGGSRFTDREVVSWLIQHKGRIQGGAFLWALAALALLVFLVSLGRRLAVARLQDNLGGVVVACGVGFVALVSAGHGAVAAMASGLDYAKPFHVDPTDARLITVLTYWLELFALVPALIAVGAVAASVRSTATLPRWVWVASAAAGVLLFVSLFVGPWGLIVVLLWVLAVSVAMWLTPAGLGPAGAGPPGGASPAAPA